MPQEISFHYGLATAIGSMPHSNASAALDLIKKTLPDGPHWPQLPKRGKNEAFIRQYLSPLLKLKLVDAEKGESPFFYGYEDDWLEKIEKFYKMYLDSCKGGHMVDYDACSLFPMETAAGFYKFLEENWGMLSSKPKFLKGQVSGPLTVGLQVNAVDKTPAFYRDDLRDIINKTLALNARYQARALKKFSLPVIIFIDEPLLLSYGQSAYVSLSREDIYESIAEVVLAINEEGAYAGVHCCSGVDWSIIFQLPLKIVSFDAYSYFESMLVYAEEMELFLKRGGCLAWGLVPTSEAIHKEDPVSLIERFWDGIRRLAHRGVTRELLERQFMLTPSCGAGTLSIKECEKVYQMTFQLQKQLQGV